MPGAGQTNGRHDLSLVFISYLLAPLVHSSCSLSLCSFFFNAYPCFFVLLFVSDSRKENFYVEPKIQASDKESAASEGNEELPQRELTEDDKQLEHGNYLCLVFSSMLMVISSL